MRTLSRSILTTLVLLALPLVARAQSSSPWGGWDALLGDWVGVSGKGTPGQATASAFQFAYDLDRHVIVRRDHSEYAASQGRPATKHDGLMVITPNADGRTFHADSYDNEGHVIAYEVTMSDTVVTFVSPIVPAAPRFRLVYRFAPPGVIVSFDIAPPGQPQAFKTYVQGACERVH